MVSRRMILKVGGASLVVMAAGGTWWGATRTPARALAPWEQAQHGFGDARLDALAFALLAPNPHNRQPWLVTLVGEDAFDLTCDLDRRLPHTDPYDRQITIGLGCFLELFKMAATAKGYRAHIDAFPDGEPQPRLDGRRIARVTLSAAEPVKDRLFDAVLERRSNKAVYDVSRPVAAEAFEKLTACNRCSGTLAPDAIDGLRELSWRAHEVESLTPRTMQESVDLMRFGKAEIEANPDGIDFSGAGNELMHLTRIMSREALADPTSVSFRQGLEMYRAIMYSAMGYVWIVSPGNSRGEQLQAGADWVRVNLQATQLGLSVHPLSQALQEYEEMADLYRQLHKALGVEEPARIQMFARIGYGPDKEPSPRWALETRVVNA